MLDELILAACTECGRAYIFLMQSVAVVTFGFFYYEVNQSIFELCGCSVLADNFSSCTI